MNICTMQDFFPFRICVCICYLLVSLNMNAQQNHRYSEKEMERKIDSLLKIMSLEEKIGQLTQYTGDRLTATGPLGKPIDKIEEVKAGRAGSLLNVRGVAQTRKMQEAALQSRLKIPLIF